ncbi:MAG: cyclic nucleotide-binding domain-containing protein, partial [Bdellovibrionales bacterium]
SLDKVELIKEIERLPLFNFLSLNMLENLVTHSNLKTYEDKTKIITQGDSNDEIFVLLSGRLVVEKIINNKFLKTGEILPISIFGEQAILENTVRGATVSTMTRSSVLCIPAPLLRELAQQSQYIRAVENFQNAIIVSQFFSSAPFFRDLSAQIVHLFTVKGKIESFKANQIIFQKGDIGDAFYLILRGSVGAVIFKNHIIPVSQGGFFGEISMFANTPRTATMFARENTQVLKIGKNAFWDILAQDMNIALYIECVGEARAHEDLVLLAEDTPKSA